MKNKLEAFREYLKSILRSKNYYLTLRPFINELEAQGITEPEQINTDVIARYISKHLKAENSINLFVNSGRAFFKWLGKDGKDNPFRNFDVIKVPKKFPEYITVEQKNEIIAGLITNYSNRSLSGMKITALINTLFHTGLRKMECVNLKREDVLFEKNHLLVRNTKSKVDRVITFCPELANDLKAYFDTEPEKKNCFNIDRGFMCRLARKIKLITGRDLNIHSWRHSYCHYYAERIPLTILQAQTGHADIKVLMRYCQADQNQIDRVMEGFFRSKNVRDY